MATREEFVAKLRTDGVTVVLEREGQKNQRLKLHRNATNRGVFETTFSDAMDGKYHVWIAAPSLEGNAAQPKFTGDGAKLCYRIVREAPNEWAYYRDAGEVRVERRRPGQQQLAIGQRAW